ncbi:MAG: hypothetical protein ACLSDI_04940 [Oscillospiraceae bacterium]
MGFLKKIFGSHSDHELKRLYPIADKIEAMSDEYAALTDEQLRAKTDEFKQRYADGESLDDCCRRRSPRRARPHGVCWA